MKITFGMALDGTDWSQAPATVGVLTVGPLGLLSVLETRMGLTGPEIPPARRVDQYMARIEDYDHDQAWLHRSFKADPWSTARQLLRWRDELVEAGWQQGQAEPTSSRLQTLEDLESLPGPILSPGRADRLREVLDELGRRPGLGIQSIQVHDPPDLLPPVWAELLERLGSMGIDIRYVSTTPSSPPSPGNPLTNLQRIQSSLREGRGPSPPSPTDTCSTRDDSFALVEASDEWEAAEQLALWLGAGFRSEGHDEAGSEPGGVGSLEDVTIICERDSFILDQVLARHGLPVIGRSRRAAPRGLLQILPLVLANVWAPASVTALIQLLSLPYGPVPARAARALLKALTKEPGIGGAAWTKALDGFEESETIHLTECGAGDPANEASRHREALEVRLGSRSRAQPGIPETDFLDRCEWVIQTLAPRVEHDPMARAALAQAQELTRLARGKGFLTRVMVERMLDTVLTPGSTDPGRVGQAAPWRVVRSPAQVEATGSVIWWDFTEESNRSCTWWGEREREALVAGGARLEPARTRRERESRGWRQAILAARDRALLFTSRARYGEPLMPHPLWDEIRHAAGMAPGGPWDAVLSALLRDAAELTNPATGRWRLAGRSVSLEPDVVADPEPARARHAVPPASIPKADRLSFSSMVSLIGCPMKWTLSKAGLRTSRTRQVPSGPRLIGNLCHHIVETLYSPARRGWRPAEVHALTGEVYDECIQSMGAELLMEGRELENQRIRARIMGAVDGLVREVTERGLVMEGTEEAIQASGDDADELPDGCSTMTGFADLLFRDPAGTLYILDLKWTTSSRFKAEEIINAEALQLATYAWILRNRSQEEEEIRAGYYMLAQCELLLPAEAPPQAESSLDAAWRKGLAGWNWRWRELSQQGVVEATGITDRLLGEREELTSAQRRRRRREAAEGEGRLPVDPPCRFCDFPGLCGMAGTDR